MKKTAILQVAHDPESGIDLQDCLIVAGVAFGEAAAFLIWKPASLILACIFCLFFAWLIERAKAKANK